MPAQERTQNRGRRERDDTDPKRAEGRAEEQQAHPAPSPEQRFRDSVGRKAARKERVRAEDDRSIFFWLGMFGMVGWAVAIPTLAGVALGLWLDRIWPAAQASWTLTFLLVGVALGALNAWYWVKRESGGD